jgi:nicotinamide-nucleotide amidase
VGVRVVRKTTVGDSPQAIADAVSSALERSGAVITTGGLGPTRDDATRAAVAGVFERRLRFDENLWEELLQRWSPWGAIPDSNRVQAQVPEGARILPNPRGTAAGLAIEDEERGICVMLPGPPHEVAAMLRGSVVAFFSERTGGSLPRPLVRLLRTTGIAESAIADRVKSALDDLSVEVAYLPRIDGVDLRLTAWSLGEAEAGVPLDEAESRLRDLLGAHIYASGASDLAAVVGDLLRERGLILAVAESCTAGLLGQRITERAGASDYFWGGMIVYEDAAKVELLGVQPETIAEHGAVSAAAAVEMARGARQRSGADVAIAITGVAGPDGGTAEKPVGTVWLAVASAERIEVKRRHYPGARDIVRARAAQGALDLLRRLLLALPS